MTAHLNPAAVGEAILAYLLGQEPHPSALACPACSNLSELRTPSPTCPATNGFSSAIPQPELPAHSFLDLHVVPHSLLRLLVMHPFPFPQPPQCLRSLENHPHSLPLLLVPPSLAQATSLISFVMEPLLLHSFVTHPHSLPLLLTPHLLHVLQLPPLQSPRPLAQGSLGFQLPSHALMQQLLPNPAP